MNFSARGFLNALLYPFWKPWAIGKEIYTAPSRSFQSVDFLKGFSVALVILFHILFTIFFVFKERKEILIQYISDFPAALNVLMNADKAVDIFFLISSFLLSYSMLKAIDKTGTYNIKRFFVHRWFRIYPLFLFALLFYGLADLNNLMENGIYSLLFIENIVHEPIIPVQWSLSIEMQFYVVLPFIILGLSKSKRPIVWIIVLILASIASRYGVLMTHPDLYQTAWIDYTFGKDATEYLDNLYYLIQSRVTPLILGILWAYIVFKYPKGNDTTSSWISIPLVIAGLTLAYLSMKFPFQHPESFFYHPFNETWNVIAITLHRVVFTAAILLMVLTLYYRPLNCAPLSIITHWRGWRVLSELAYPMYFFHFPFIVIAWVAVLGTTDLDSIQSINAWSVPVVFLFTTSMTLYVSIILHAAIERRFIRVGKRVDQRWFAEQEKPAQIR